MIAPSVGLPLPRTDGFDKVTGRAAYVDDLRVPGCLHGATIRSTIPHGRLRRIRRDPAFDWSGFTFVTAADIPGQNVIALITDDQPALVDGIIRHAEEPVCLLAHRDRERLLAGLRAVTLECDPLPAALTIREGLARKAKIYGRDNIFKEIRIRKGEVRTAFRGAHRIVEGTFRTGLQEQLYIETNGMIAIPERGGRMSVLGSLQCPYYVHKALKRLLGVGDDRVRVVQTTTGGGFGGKEEYPSMLAAHCALLARKAGKPVKIVYDRLEDLAATTKRHPSVVRHRTAVSREGRLLGMDIDVLMDGGAYLTLSPVVLSRGAIHAAGPYRCENLAIRARAVATNTPPNGAFRGFGAPQTIFAVEMQLNRIARALRIDPVELRRRNVLRPGDSTATGQVLDAGASGPLVLEEAVRRSGWSVRRASFTKRAPPDPERASKAPRKGTASGRIRRGLGLSLFYHGAGFTGIGEVYLDSHASLAVTRDGSVEIHTASTEIGQGMRTTFAQIVGDELGLPPSMVRLAPQDTSLVPNSGPTVASRTCMIVGKILANAAADLRDALVQWAGDSPRRAPGRRATRGPWNPQQFRRLASAWVRKTGPKVFTRKYDRPPGMKWDEKEYRGDAYGAFGWGVNVAEVEVDAETFEIRVPRVDVVLEIGTVVNPLLAQGQAEGGTLQGVGYALTEEVVRKNGRMANAQLTNYIIPTTADTPEFRTTLLSNAYRHGPFGAKGMGELPLDGPGPAIAAAIENALGVSIVELPITPERLAKAIRARPAHE
ncbi:MAG: xanthine dehydrogenase family protein [Planctomycetes bacterium]|nr:xanthine dehydrogenase family protein [Planctomycetota bacterium]